MGNIVGDLIAGNRYHRGVLDRHARQDAELDRLFRDRERGRDQRLRGDHGRERGDRDDGVEQGTARQRKERVRDHLLAAVDLVRRLFNLDPDRNGNSSEED